MTTKNPLPAKNQPDSRESFRTVDEFSFMRECATRLNGFLQTYPEEAQHVLRAFVPYKHELVEIHEAVRRQRRAEEGITDEPRLPPGVSFAALFAAVLQTHHGVGYYLRPLLDEDPDSPTFGRLLRVEVTRQDEDEGAEHQA